MDKHLVAAAQAQADVDQTSGALYKKKDTLCTRRMIDNMLAQLAYFWIHSFLPGVKFF